MRNQTDIKEHSTGKDNGLKKKKKAVGKGEEEKRAISVIDSKDNWKKK